MRASEFESVTATIDNGATVEETAAIHSLLTSIYRGAYAEAAAVWNLREPQYWANLKLLGDRNLREQESLKAALIRLRKTWRGSCAKAKTAVHVVDPSAAGGKCDQPA